MNASSSICRMYLHQHIVTYAFPCALAWMMDLRLRELIGTQVDRNACATLMLLHTESLFCPLFLLLLFLFPQLRASSLEILLARLVARDGPGVHAYFLVGLSAEEAWSGGLWTVRAAARGRGTSGPRARNRGSQDYALSAFRARAPGRGAWGWRASAAGSGFSRAQKRAGVDESVSLSQTHYGPTCTQVQLYEYSI